MFTGIQHWETRFIIIIQKCYRGHIIVTIINLWEEIKHNIEDEKEFQNKLSQSFLLEQSVRTHEIRMKYEYTRVTYETYE